MTLQSHPDYSGNSCALLSIEDREKLWKAACTLADARGLIIRITSFVGQGTEWAGGKAAEIASKMFGEGWEAKIKVFAEDALRQGHDLATLGMDADGDREPWSWFNKIMSSAVGAAGGFFGLPGMAVDIPVSTLLIMRSIAEIARAHGEDITSTEGQRACLEVMAFGGYPGEDGDVEAGYWSTRAAFAHVAIEIAIKQAASRLGVVLSEKALAQIVPVAGAFAGAGLNYVFMDFYQEMARVHFTVRVMERKYNDDGAIKACLEHLVRQAKIRHTTKKPGDDFETAVAA